MELYLREKQRISRPLVLFVSGFMTALAAFCYFIESAAPWAAVSALALTGICIFLRPRIPQARGAAIALATQTLEESAARMTKLRDKLIAGIAQRIPEVKLNGHPTMRLPNNVNYSIKYIEGESILLMLDMNGIAASSGSACTSGSLDPSHVLLALGLSHEVAHGSVRLTLSDETTEEDIDYVLDVLPKVAERLRAMSPLYHA